MYQKRMAKKNTGKTMEDQTDQSIIYTQKLWIFEEKTINKVLGKDKPNSNILI